MNFLPDVPGGRGSFRKVNVTVGGRHCPHFNEVPRLLDSWLEEMYDWQMRDPKTMHVKFEHIHPFVDGNGRTGRMLLWWHERRLGLKPSLITFEDRWDYYAWF
jgi:cell filamentation protein, protein adenylyltransferase